MKKLKICVAVLAVLIVGSSVVAFTSTPATGRERKGIALISGAKALPVVVKSAPASNVKSVSTRPSTPTKRGTRFLFRRTKAAQTIGSQPVEVAVFNVLDNSVMHVQVRIVAIDLLSGKAKTWNIQGGFKRFNGILSLIANDIDIEFEAGDPITGQWDGSIEFNDVTDELCVRFQGRANQTIEWFADFEVDLYQP